MISIGSKSYPYLAIAKHYDVPYSEVLALVESFDIDPDKAALTKRWMIDVFHLWHYEHWRRANL